MRKFKSIENIRDASLEELTETESMNAGSAQKFMNFFMELVHRFRNNYTTHLSANPIAQV